MKTVSKLAELNNNVKTTVTVIDAPQAKATDNIKRKKSKPAMSGSYK